jgi:hypothetical protein
MSDDASGTHGNKTARKRQLLRRNSSSAVLDIVPADGITRAQCHEPSPRHLVDVSIVLARAVRTWRYGNL